MGLKEQMIANASGLVIEPHDDEDSIKVNGIVLHRSGTKDKYGYVVGENHVCQVGYDFVTGGAWVHGKRRELRPWVNFILTNWPKLLVYAVIILALAYLTWKAFQ